MPKKLRLRIFIGIFVQILDIIIINNYVLGVANYSVLGRAQIILDVIQ